MSRRCFRLIQFYSSNILVTFYQSTTLMFVLSTPMFAVCVPPPWLILILVYFVFSKVFRSAMIFICFDIILLIVCIFELSSAAALSMFISYSFVSSSCLLVACWIKFLPWKHPIFFALWRGLYRHFAAMKWEFNVAHVLFPSGLSYQ